MTDQRGCPKTTEEDHPRLHENRDFLRLLIGRLVTNAGDSLYSIGILWLVFEMTNSTFLTGIASSLLLLPFLLQIISGPIVDRVSVKPVLVWTQFVQGLVILVLPAAAFMDSLTVELIFAIIPVLSILNQIIRPAQASIVPRIVAENQLSQSNSALATVTLGLDVLFQAFGGILIAVFGVMTLFWIDSTTFLVAGVLFLGITIPKGNSGGNPTEKTDITEYVASLRSGIGVLRGTLFVELILTSAVFNFAIGVTLAILPAFGGLRGGPAVYGLMLGALGTGRLLGSLTAPHLEGVAYGPLKAITYMISMVFWLGSVYSPSLVLTVGLFGLAWVSAGVNGVMIETLTQKVFPNHFLGRVSSIRGTASTATLPIGSLVGGYIAEPLGIVPTMGMAAFGFGFAGLYFALRPSLRGLPSIKNVNRSELNITIDSS